MAYKYWSSYLLLQRYIVRHVSSDLSMCYKLFKPNSSPATWQLSSGFKTGPFASKLYNYEDSRSLGHQPESHDTSLIYESADFDLDVDAEAHQKNLALHDGHIDKKLLEEFDSIPTNERMQILSQILLKKIRSSTTIEELMDLFTKHYSLFNQESFYAFLRSLSYLSRNNQDFLIKREINGLINCAYKHFSVCQSISDNLNLMKFMMKHGNPKISLLKDLLDLFSARLLDFDLMGIMFFVTQSESPLWKSYLDKLLVRLPLAVQMLITEDNLKELSDKHLIKLCSYCVEHNIVGLHHLLEEISNRELSSPQSALSVLSCIFGISPHSVRELLLPGDAEETLESLAKKCFAIAANNIQEYSPVQIRSLIDQCITAYKKDFYFARNEEFMRAVSSSASFFDGSIERLKFINNCTSLGMIIPDFTRETVSLVLQHPDKAPPQVLYRLLHPVSHSRVDPAVLREFLTLVEGRLAYTKIEFPPVIAILSFLEMNYFPRKLLETFYTTGIEGYAKNFFTGKTSTLQEKINHYFINELSTLDYHLKVMDPHTPYALSPKISAMMRDFQRRQPRTWRLENHFHSLLGPNSVTPSVSFKENLFVDYLLVVDEGGKPVPISSSHSGEYTPFDSLDIPEGTRKIVILEARDLFLFQPSCQIFPHLRMMQRIIESEGFEVLLCGRTKSSLKEALLNAGISFL